MTGYKFFIHNQYVVFAGRCQVLSHATGEDKANPGNSKAKRENTQSNEDIPERGRVGYKRFIFHTLSIAEKRFVTSGCREGKYQEE